MYLGSCRVFDHSYVLTYEVAVTQVAGVIGETEQIIRTESAQIQSLALTIDQVSR